MAAEANPKTDMNEWITFLKEKKYEDLYRYLKQYVITRSRYYKQHTSCWDLQLFCMILYYMYKNKNRYFMDYMYKTSNNNEINKLIIATIITSIYKNIQDDKNYWYEIIIGKKFTYKAIGKDIINFFSIDALKEEEDGMYPMIIYKFDTDFNTNIIDHYFTIIKSGETYYILNSWGSDTLCALPSIAPIEKEEFSKLSTLLSRFNLISLEERIECKELIKKYFLQNAVNMYSNKESVKEGSRVTPQEGIPLELKGFKRRHSYHIALINGYETAINEMVLSSSRSRSRSSSRHTHRNNKNRSPHSPISSRSRSRHTHRNNRNRSPYSSISSRTRSRHTPRKNSPRKN